VSEICIFWILVRYRLLPRLRRSEIQFEKH